MNEQPPTDWPTDWPEPEKLKETDNTAWPATEPSKGKLHLSPGLLSLAIITVTIMVTGYLLSWQAINTMRQTAVLKPTEAALLSTQAALSATEVSISATQVGAVAATGAAAPIPTRTPIHIYPQPTPTPPDSYSADFTVNNQMDGDDANPGDGICETTAGSGVCTLRAAISEANALFQPGLITLPPGTYTLRGEANEDNNATGDLDITTSLTIHGLDPAETIIQAATDTTLAQDRVLHMPNPDTTVTIQNVTIRYGKLNESRGLGGGIFNAGNLRLENSVVSHNTAEFGGGIYNNHILNIVQSTLHDNTATISGGAIATGSLYEQQILTEIAGSTISGNQAEAGGGLYVSANNADVHLTVYDTTFAYNTAVASGEHINLFIFKYRLHFLISNTLLAGSEDSFAHTIIGDGIANIFRDYTIASDNTLFTEGVGNQNNVALTLPTLTNNGGNLPTHALPTNSPAIDAGNCTLPTDQRRQHRPVDGNQDGTTLCDVGAFEYQ